MIIGKLQGGLGNQMFQYAALRSMCLRLQTEGCLDLSAYGQLIANETPRNFELDVFNIQLSRSTMEQAQMLVAANGLLSHLRKWFGRTEIITLNEMNFDSFIQAPCSGVCHMVGYWQSERFFKEHAEAIRKEFTLMLPLEDDNQRLLDKIKSDSTISIHVRRGDYVTNANASQFHGTCPPAYYYDAVALIAQSKTIDHIYVFSDDMEWVKQNLKFEQPMTLVDHNSGANAYIDLILMAACTHHIIANSSFSWWGAWLNPAPDKLVVAPRKWFVANNHKSNEIIPSSWTQL